ncbi:NADH dehydrogenase [ubiquinone] 1 alpha subcomplex subunit [Dirofilaria immitis]
MTTDYRQDMPPPGGYSKFNWARTYPKVFWKAEKLLGVVAFLFGYGLFQARALKRAALTERFEDKDLYIAMTPFLYAERDRRWLKLLKQNRDNEIKLAEISGDKAWRVGTWYGEPVYFTLQGRWWDPTPYEAYAHSPMKNVYENFEFIHRSDHV